MDRRREIPSVDRLLSSPAFSSLLAGSPRALVLRALQRVQDELRHSLSSGVAAPSRLSDDAWYAERTSEVLARLERPSLRPLINATGVVLHTNLGRAPLAEAALRRMELVSRGYSNLEYHLEEGRRGSRYDHCAGLLTELTGAEAALVVNNNAAALVLALNTLAHGREAVISRGELVEIGGSFRIPEIMERSGARMREVGSTNRTHAADYQNALSERTGAVLKVHRSNFRVTGYTAEVETPELARIARSAGVPLLHDLGSGLLLDPERLGLPREPTPAQALEAEADVVTLSGDKLLGGPQAGILLGRARHIDAMRRNPLCRALRVDKLTLAALEATLELYREPERALREIPVLRMLSRTEHELAERADRLAARLREAGVVADVAEGASAVGGGALPDVELPTRIVRLGAEGRSAEEYDRRLRAGSPPVVGRIIDERLALDLRTVADEEEDALYAAIVNAAL